jgi:hypothetical protein
MQVVASFAFFSCMHNNSNGLEDEGDFGSYKKTQHLLRFILTK